MFALLNRGFFSLTSSILMVLLFFFLFTFVTDMLIKGCLQFLSLEDVMMGFEFVLGIWEDEIFLA
jgi:hypothetical protein